MKNRAFLAVLVFLLVGISFVSAAPAQTFVTGKIYDQVYGGVGLGDVGVSINCAGTVRTGTSLASGDYGVVFNNSDCSNGSAMTVTLSKDGYKTGAYTSSGISTIILGADELLVVNFPLVDATIIRNNGGSNSRACSPSFWDCDSEDWSECSDGSQTKICTSNCGTQRTETQACELDQEIILDDGVSEADVIEQDGFFSAITGAVIGGGATSVGIGVGVLIIIVIGGYVLVRRKAKK